MAADRELPEYAAMMRRMLRGYTTRVADAGDPGALAGLAAFAHDAEQALGEAVQRQRAQGASWAQVGNALGVTRSAAQKRFGGAGSRTTGGQPIHLR